jgi:hypothetical protein
MASISDISEYRKRDASLKSGGGDGTFEGMEARVSKLEGQFDKLNDKVDGLRIDVAVLKEKVSNLPSKGFIVTATVGALALFSALVLFQERIAALLGG